MSIRNKAVISAVGAACILSASMVSAATLTLGADQAIDSSISTTFVLDLNALGLESTTAGGGIVINFDPTIVSLASSTFDSYWDTIGGEVTDNANGTYRFVAGTFSNAPVATDTMLMTSLTFNILSDGVVDFTFSDYGRNGAGDWLYTTPTPVAVGAAAAIDTINNYCLTNASGLLDPACVNLPTGNAALPLFLDTTSVTISAVPVPAAVWLFLSGLAGLVGVSRRKAV